MTIRPARPEETDDVLRFYHRLIDALVGAECSPRWTKGVYPTRADLASAAAAGELWLGTEGEEIAAAMVVNHGFNEGYASVPWIVDAPDEDIWALHLLAVDPSRPRRGLGRRMTERAIALVRGRGGRSLRLDVIDGNRPAERLYDAVGFRTVSRSRIYYEDTGWADFLVMEYPIPPLSLRPVGSENAAAAYDLFQRIPPENGFENSWYGLSSEEFLRNSVPAFAARAEGRDLPPGHVPDTCFLLWEKDGPAGVFKVRHFLSDALRRGSGHIGYAIRPDLRGRGYATRGLALAIDPLKAFPDFAENEVFLSCDEANAASLAVMRANGGYIHHTAGGRHFVRIPVGDQRKERMYP